MRCLFLESGMYVNTQGKLSPCCIYNDPNSDVFVEDFENYPKSQKILAARDMLDRDIWPSGCYNCKRDEELGVLSLRQQSLVELKIPPDQLVIDFALGNLCNSDCVMCFPLSSSRVASRLQQHKKNYIKVDSSWCEKNEFWQKLTELLPKIHRLRFQGGEPFLNKKLWKWLKSKEVNQIKHKINLHITTNASYLENSNINVLEDWNRLVINASLDATGKNFEWIRHGLNWETVEKNVSTLSKIKNSDIGVSHVLGAYSISGFENLANWIEKNNYIFNAILLENPNYQSLKHMPKHILENSLEKISKIKMSSIQNQINLAKVRKYIKDAIANNCYDQTESIKWINYHNSYRKKYQLNFNTYEIL